MNNHSKELLAVLTAFISSPIVPIIHIALIRIFRNIDKAIKFMMLSFVIYGVFWVVSFFIFNGFKSSSFLELIAGYSTVGFLCLVYAEVFSMICRGFSLRIITDIYLHSSLTFPQVIENYGGGMGMDWMLRKRIETMEALGMVKLEGDTIKIKRPWGTSVGRMGVMLKKNLKLGLGG